MSLDLTTLLFVSSLLSITVSALYLLEVSRRERLATVDRCWILTFVAVIVATFCYGATGLSGRWWWANAIGDALLVFSMGALWSGVRAAGDRTPRLWLPGATALLTFSTGMLAGPEAGAWGAAFVYLPGVALWTALAATGILTGPLRSQPGGSTLAVAAGAWAVFYSARLVVAIVDGVTSQTFDRYLGGGVASVVNLVLIVIGAFSIIRIRSGEALTEVIKTFRFDPYLGARTTENFRLRATELLARYPPGPHEVGCAAVRLEVRELDAISDAYGEAAKELATVLVARCLSELAPREALVGCVEGTRSAFDVILPHADAVDAHEWIRALRDRLRETPLVVGGDRLHVGVSAAVGTGSGDLDDLLVQVRDGMEPPS